MRHKTLAEELADIRMTLRRLQRRERQLEAQLGETSEGTAVSRPGWPIQRLGADHHLN